MFKIGDKVMLNGFKASGNDYKYGNNSNIDIWIKNETVLTVIDIDARDGSLSVSDGHADFYFHRSELRIAKDNGINQVNGDDMEKLVPRNEQQEHMVQILLAFMQKKCVEARQRHGENTWYNWGTPSDIKSLHLNETEIEYRIKPKQTPLLIPDWFWSGIDKQLTKAALNPELDSITFYPKYVTPYIEDGQWITDKDPYYTFVNPELIGVSLKGIDWHLSLTKRPEGL